VGQILRSARRRARVAPSAGRREVQHPRRHSLNVCPAAAGCVAGAEAADGRVARPESSTLAAPVRTCRASVGVRAARRGGRGARMQAGARSPGGAPRAASVRGGVGSGAGYAPHPGRKPSFRGLVCSRSPSRAGRRRCRDPRPSYAPGATAPAIPLSVTRGRSVRRPQQRRRLKTEVATACDTLNRRDAGFTKRDKFEGGPNAAASWFLPFLSLGPRGAWVGSRVPRVRAEVGAVFPARFQELGITAADRHLPSPAGAHDRNTQ
jgi:hypothetical protein